MALTRVAFGAAAIASVAASPAGAHAVGAASSPAPGWTWDGWITVPLGLALALFATGWMRIRRRSTGGARALARRGWIFLAGWAVLAGALVSPLHRLGEQSFAAHMFEHELLMLVAAPLLVTAQPLAVLLWAFSPRARRALGDMANASWVTGTWRALTGPVTATVIQAAALWLWHAPALFDLGLADEGWHAVQHLSFLVSALLFWTAMFRRATPRGTAALCLFATSLVTGALGALMAFSASPWYARYVALGLAPFGLSPAEDQQLAGLLMWIPGGMVHAGVALAIVHAMLREEGPAACVR